ncbi:hypothetical protein PseBG33_4069 [Pseudomonas synxantha BG33R]|uniref:DEAD/DEAH box helicase n=1 Tax=Pseudomonas synxantha TaxID=47883 RepID=UPI00025FE18B|nr:DEAD/DEAH box helicase [Pseudomonas synxantha]EIK71287.1 hypothetical protein PseBG33_4069 [Pseudomonas synxantha BG33R]
MNCITRIKPIFTAIAAPGAGKTEALLSSLPAIQKTGRPVVLALPTLVLIDHIAERASQAGIPFRIVDNRNGERVAPELEAALQDKCNSFIICTQEAIRRVRHSLLHDWTLIIDEVPKVVDYPDYALNPTELSRVLDYTEEANGQLWIKEEFKQDVRDQVSTNRADSVGIDCSTLGTPAAHIFRLLLSEVTVFIDQPQKNGIRHVRAVEEFLDWWDILSSADEAHVLAANIAGGEFELLAQLHGFTFKKSMYAPETGHYTSPVTIYPIMPKGQIFSKAKMNADQENNKLYDLALDAILRETSSNPLLFANSWVRHKEKGRVQQVQMDCRGLNGYDSATEAILLFGGNPSPSDMKGLEYLSKKYSQDLQVMQTAFVTTRLLEPSLQAVTRTAIRRMDTTSSIRLYVQDERVARYLMETYMPHAVVDWSVSKKIPVKPDGRRKEHSQKQAALALVKKDVPDKEIARRLAVSPKTIRNWKRGSIAA